MDKFLFLLLFLFLSTFSYAQNYRIINPTREYFYEYIRDNANGLNYGKQINAIRIDSIFVTGSDTAYYNYKVFQYTGDNPCAAIISDTSWIGHKIIRKAGGEYKFFNSFYDTIQINSAGKLNDSWILFFFTNGDYIQAVINSIGIENILGNPDTVKTILLQAKNNSGNNISNIFNGMSFKLSRNYGLVKTYNLYNFPSDTMGMYLTGITNPTLGRINITTRDIYDYDIGDEFHFYSQYNDVPFGSNAWTRYSKKIILNKTFSSSQDTVFYFDSLISVNYTYSIQNNTTTKTIVADTFTEAIHFNDQLYLDKLPFEPNTGNSSPAFIYTTLYLNGQYNNRSMKIIPYDLYSYDSTNSCFNLLIWDCFAGCSLPAYYIDGLGGPYWHSNQWVMGANEYNLVYFKKNNEEWGIPVNFDSLLTSFKIIPEEKPFMIYPNPIREILYVDNPVKKQILLSLFNFIGEKIISRISIDERISVNIATLPHGIYNAQIIIDGNIWNNKIVKVGK